MLVLYSFFVIHFIAPKKIPQTANGAISSSNGKITTDPTFLTRSESFKFKYNDTITLPCEVINVDDYMVAWKRGIAILTAGQVKVSPDPRIRLVNGYSLQITSALPTDAGDYICQIAMLHPREITHMVEILSEFLELHLGVRYLHIECVWKYANVFVRKMSLKNPVPPKIHRAPPPTIPSKKGETVTVECNASGNPIPNVTWTRKNNLLLPNGNFQLTIIFDHNWESESQFLFYNKNAFLWAISVHDRRNDNVGQRTDHRSSGPEQGRHVHLHGKQRCRYASFVGGRGASYV